MSASFMAEDGEVDDKSFEKETSQSCPDYNVGDPARRIWVFTTASLPWMTGTAVNPLLRAAYLTRGRDKGKVTLGVPWVEVADQEKLFSEEHRFDTSDEQAAYVREWLTKGGLGDEANNLDVLFYPARYHEGYGSIFPMGDLAALVPDDEADVAVLEEPEHLNFFRTDGVPWLKKFEYVIGVIHTNYQFYARGEKHGIMKKPIVNAACKFTVRAHCHRIIKLSDALQSYAPEKEMVENVHGVRPKFFEVGDKAHEEGFTGDAYFIGKVLWTKGIDILFALMHHAREEKASNSTEEPKTDSPFPITIHGSGDNLTEVKEEASQLGLPVTFEPAIDHAELGQYKIFVNPSRSEVLCTTIAEALAMGKWVVCARHPSNEFFYENFSTCLSFSDESEFMECMKKALSEDPPSLAPEVRHKLSWAAATDRFLTAVSRPEVPGRSRVWTSARGLARLDKLMASFHTVMMTGKRGDRIRKALGGGPVARQASYVRKQREQLATASGEGQSNGDGSGDET